MFDERGPSKYWVRRPIFMADIAYDVPPESCFAKEREEDSSFLPFSKNSRFLENSLSNQSYPFRRRLFPTVCWMQTWFCCVPLPTSDSKSSKVEACVGRAFTRVPTPWNAQFINNIDWAIYRWTRYCNRILSRMYLLPVLPTNVFALTRNSLNGLEHKFNVNVPNTSISYLCVGFSIRPSMSNLLAIVPLVSSCKI